MASVVPFWYCGTSCMRTDGSALHHVRQETVEAASAQLLQATSTGSIGLKVV